jgi:hypothetical protein
MKTGSIISEAWRNIASGTTRAVTYTLTLFVVAVTIAFFDLATIINLQNEAAQWSSSGANINILPAENQINPASCENLSHTAGTDSDARHGSKPPISASGALSAGGDITVKAMQSAPLPSYAVTPSLAEVLKLESDAIPAPGVWVSSQLAHTMKISRGDALDTIQGPMQIAGVFQWPDDSRDQRIAYAVLIPSASTKPYDECWASITPSNQQAADLLRTSAIAVPNAATTTQVKQLNNALGAGFDGWSQYQHRASRVTLLATPITALMIGFIAIRSRRVEIADDLHSGIPRTSLWVTSTLETFAWSIPAIGAASATLYLGAAHLSDQANAFDLLFTESTALIASLITAQFGAAIALSTIKEAQLFKYFKSL